MADTLPSTAEVDAIVEQVSNWGRWGPDDERGALNLISDAKRAQAAALVQDGVAISCSLPLPVTPAIDNPEPVQHHMLAAGDLPEGARIPGLAYTADYFAISCHGLATTHLDALCHIVVKDKIYNGFDASSVMSDGATRNSVMAGRDGLVSRGVLLDIPGLRGVDWLEPGDRIARSELDAAEARQGQLRHVAGQRRDPATEARGAQHQPAGGTRPRVVVVIMIGPVGALGGHRRHEASSTIQLRSSGKL